MTVALPTGRRGQMLASALTLGALALIWQVLVSPAIGWYGERADHLAQRQALARRMAEVAASLPALQHDLAARAPGGPSRDALLQGATDAIAGADLQQMVQDMAAKVGATLASIETLPAAQAGAYRRIGLHVSLNARWQVLIRLLQSVAQAPSEMLIDDVQMRADRQATAVADPPMEASFTIIAFRAGGPAAVQR
jgi:general secretion pathway protein M